MSFVLSVSSWFGSAVDNPAEEALQQRVFVVPDDETPAEQASSAEDNSSKTVETKTESSDNGPVSGDEGHKSSEESTAADNGGHEEEGEDLCEKAAAAAAAAADKVVSSKKVRGSTGSYAADFRGAKQCRGRTLGSSHWDSAMENDGGQSKSRMRKLTRELRSLKTSLPLSAEAAIFLRFDNSRPYKMQALISGPPGTPYEAGLFLFDIYLPADYPNVPPKVQLMTTGSGTVCFSPNLYECGYVCLSLLGTWSGPGWDARHSSVHQVLVSIQSLIMGVPYPHYNEPGYGGWEAEDGAACDGAGDDEALQYNARVRRGTVAYAMADMIRQPPPGFRKVVAIHFLHRRHRIRELLSGEWRGDVPEEEREKLEEALCSLDALLG